MDIAILEWGFSLVFVAAGGVFIGAAIEHRRNAKRLSEAAYWENIDNLGMVLMFALAATFIMSAVVEGA